MMRVLLLLVVIATAQVGSGSLQERARMRMNFQPLKLLNRLQSVVEKPVRFAYASSMALRVGYFITQYLSLSVTGIVRTGLESDKENYRPLIAQCVINALVDVLLSDDLKIAELIKPSMVEEIYADEADHQRQFFSKNFAAIATVLRKDLKNIENGLYNYPYDLDIKKIKEHVLPRRQLNPMRVAQLLVGYTRDQVEVNARRNEKRGFDIRDNFISNRYPDYYLQNFHYQTDGWLSAKSARLYDYQVESLFFGTADAMRRMILPDIKSFMQGKDPAEVKLLDMASGTGRFASFILDNHPTLDATIMDLSPFYLSEAREVLKAYPQVQYAETYAEDMSCFSDGQFDAISCVYLFHELPEGVRSQVLKEMFRVLKPGGKLFVIDSSQKNEIPTEEVLETFSIIAHEPYYMDYIDMDLSGAIDEAGFAVDRTEVNWVSKCVISMKPLTPRTPRIIPTEGVKEEGVKEEKEGVELTKELNLKEVVAHVVAEAVGNVGNKEGGEIGEGGVMPSIMNRTTTTMTTTMTIEKNCVPEVVKGEEGI